MRPDTDAVLHELRTRGHRMTPQRRAIVAAIMSARGHISAQEIAARVRDSMPRVNDSTVYRTLELLEEIGVLTHAHLGPGYDYHHAAEHDHVHLLCAKCGKEEVLKATDLQSPARAVTRRTGFVPDFTHFAIAGLCRDCRWRN